MKLTFALMLFVFPGCGVSITPAPSGTGPLVESDFDGWKDSAPQSEARHPDVPTTNPDAAGQSSTAKRSSPKPELRTQSITAGILDTVLNHVQSAEIRMRAPGDVSSKPSSPSITTHVRSPDAVEPAPDQRRFPQASGLLSHLGPPPAPPSEEQKALAAARSGCEVDVPDGWTGAVLYCQPGCQPCQREEHDIRAAGWKVGPGNDCHFKSVTLVAIQEFADRRLNGTPTVVYFRGGHEVGQRIERYDGSATALYRILANHPRVDRASLRSETVTNSPGLATGCSAPAAAVFLTDPYTASGTCGAPFGSYPPAFPTGGIGGTVYGPQSCAVVPTPRGLEASANVFGAPLGMGIRWYP